MTDLLTKEDYEKIESGRVSMLHGLGEEPDTIYYEIAKDLLDVIDNLLERANKLETNRKSLETPGKAFSEQLVDQIQNTSKKVSISELRAEFEKGYRPDELTRFHGRYMQYETRLAWESCLRTAGFLGALTNE